LSILLRSIPEDRLRTMGWASFFLAVAHLDATPALTLPLLDQATDLFVQQHDSVGELLSLSHNISTRITTTGHYRGGEELLHRAVQLFSQVADTLDPATTILVARNLAMGYCIFLADVDEANRFGSLALTLARKEQLLNFEAALLMVMGYIRIFAGHTSLAKMYLEQAAPFVCHPEVGTFNRLAIRMMLFNFLFHEGDFANYFNQKHRLIAIFGVELVSQSIAGPFCYIWEMDIALHRGEPTTTLALAEAALAQHPSFSPHLVSQIQQLKGVALALLGRHEQALAAVAESRRLRELAGGRYFITLNKLLSGLVHALCGFHQQGIAWLDDGIADARCMPTEYLESCGLLHRAEALLANGQQSRALQDIETGIRMLGRNGYHHFWAWNPAAMTRILSLAVRHGYEPAYARRLAADRLHLSVLDDGTTIPLLDFQTLGVFKIAHQGVTLLEAEALTPVQRELLALLLAAPGLKMPQETLCHHLWPDSPQTTVKIKFDTLISRLRKTLAEALPDNTAHLYLNREKGMLWLAHCRIDAHTFLDGVKQGLVHFRLQEFWQAENVFTTVEPLWQGEFSPGAAGDDRIRHFRDTLVTSLSELAIAWSELLAKSDRLSTAVRLVDKALLHDPLNERLYALLYRLEGQRSALHSRQVLHRFKAVLRQDGYQDQEIADLLQTIVSSPPPGRPFAE
jgi:DNA-binding SARP family transcriptional activator